MKVLKNVARAIKKTVKKVTGSKLGRVLLGAALIYVGGGALGAWKTPFKGINGILAKGGASSGAGSGTTAAAGEALQGGYAAAQPGTTIPGIAGSGPGGSATLAKTAASGANYATAQPGTPVADIAGSGPGSVAAAPEAAAGGYAAAQPGMPAVAAPTVGKPSILSRMMSSAGKMGSWAADNQFLTAMAITGIGGALSPDELDMMEQDRQWKEQDRLRREGNLDVSGVDVGRVRDEPLTYMSGNRVFTNGVLNRTARSM